jgi:hypothetical protein
METARPLLPSRSSDPPRTDAFLLAAPPPDDYHARVKRPVHRRRRGFEALAEITPDKLGLSRGRSVQLLLEATWDEVAGETLARRARPLSLRRGVLEVEVADDRWIEPLLSLIPRIAGRLNARRPELGIRKLKIRAGGQLLDRLPAAAEVEDCAPTEPSPPDLESARLTIEQVRDRYLARLRSR